MNGSGLTIVKYVHEYVRYEWFDDSPLDLTTVVFIFRRDGRDYRDFPGTQVIYMAVLETNTPQLQQPFAVARAVVESFMFLDGATIGLEPSETARSIGITAYNFPRTDGSTSVTSLVAGLSQYEAGAWRLWSTS